MDRTKIIHAATSGGSADFRRSYLAFLPAGPLGSAPCWRGLVVAFRWGDTAYLQLFFLHDGVYDRVYPDTLATARVSRE